MMSFLPGLYVIPHPHEKAPPPVPDKSNHFSKDTAYMVLGGFTMSESAEMYFMLANDLDQLFFISNRHLQFYGMKPDLDLPRIKGIGRHE